MSAIAHMVRQTLNASVEPPKVTGRITPDEIETMIRLRGQGLTMTAIGERIGRPRGTVSKQLIKIRAARR